MNDDTPKPPRRKRYSGKNPQRFEDKYKELNPELHADTVAKVIASGKTPAGSHIPILVEECMEALKLAPGMTGVDATLGHGGHASRMLERIAPDGKLIGLDVDPVEFPRTVDRLRAAGFGEDRFLGIRSNYAGMARALANKGIYAVDFIFADLGCSSMQLDNPARGFSFKAAGPLDMRMNPGRGPSAAAWLSKVSTSKLELLLQENADEPRAESIAAALAGNTYADTLALAAAIREAVNISDGALRELTVRRVFQAIRIAVNEEFTALDAFMRALPGCLKSGARAAILTFHSGEDRRVKLAMKTGIGEGVYSEMNDGVITVSAAEKRANPRSSSAKLRWVTRA